MEKESGSAVCYCSFCGKSQEEVMMLIAGPKTFVCDECVELMAEMVSRYRVKPKDGE
jgi:ATP-dependent Clp protease ATP-binding subunit ClpX